MSIVTRSQSQGQVRRREQFIGLARLGLFAATLLLWFCSGYLQWKSSSMKHALDRDIRQPLERASHAPTVEIAKSNISTALSFVHNDMYLQERLANDSESSQSFRTWYLNLEILQQDLSKVSPKAITLIEEQIILEGVNRSLGGNPDMLTDTSYFWWLDFLAALCLFTSMPVLFCLELLFPVLIADPKEA